MTAVHNHIDSKQSIRRDQLITVGDLETVKTHLLTELSLIIKVIQAKLQTVGIKAPRSD